MMELEQKGKYGVSHNKKEKMGNRTVSIGRDHSQCERHFLEEV